MKILVVTQYFWPENFKVNDFTEWMAGRGHELTVLTGIPNYPEGRFYPGYGLFKKTRQRLLGARIVRSPLSPRGASGVCEELILNYLSFAVSAAFTGLFGLKGRFDAIFVFASSPITVCLPAILLKKLRGTPLYLWVLDLWPESVFEASHLHSRVLFSALSGLVRFIYGRCDRIFISSRPFKRSIASRGADEAKIEYLPNWAEDLFLGKKTGGDSAVFSSLLPEGFRVMFAGNIGEAQDFESILKAAEILKDRRNVKWVVLGDGRKKPWVERQIAERGLGESVALLGRFPVDSMPAFYSFADVMLVSLKSSGIFSMTVPARIQSYMASGKPVVTMLDGEGSAIVAEAGAGLTSGAGDFSGLAANVLKLSQMDKAELKKMASNALAYYKEHFDKDTLLKRVEKILRAGKT